MKLITYLVAALLGGTMLLYGGDSGNAQQVSGVDQESQTACSVVINRSGFVRAKECRSTAPGSLGVVTTVVGDPSLIQSSTPLVQLWKDSSYSPNPGVTVYGDSGTCDAAGYRIPDVAWLITPPYAVSSMQFFGSCRVSVWWEGTRTSAYRGTYSGRKLGQYWAFLADWDNRIGSMKIYSV